MWTAFLGLLVIGKAPGPVDHNDLLMDTVVSGSQGIRDDLQRLVRGENGLSTTFILLVYATARY